MNKKQLYFVASLIWLGICGVTHSSQISLEKEQMPKIEYLPEDMHEEKKHAEQSIENLETTPQYKLILPDGQSMMFSKPLIEQSELLKTALMEKGENAYPITQYIMKLAPENSDEISLEELHTILRIIADNSTNPEQGLRKFLFEKNPSTGRMIQLFQIAIYFDIPVLVTLMAKEISSKLVDDRHSKEYLDAISHLPEAWQARVTAQIVLHNKTLTQFIETNYKPARLLSANAEIIKITWSHQGNFIATVLKNGQIQIWDLTTGIAQNLGNARAGTVHSLTWSNDDSKLLSARDQQLHIWDTKTGQLLHEMGFIAKLASAFWLSDSQIATISLNGTIQIWDVNTGHPLHQWPSSFGDYSPVNLEPV